MGSYIQSRMSCWNTCSGMDGESCIYLLLLGNILYWDLRRPFIITKFELDFEGGREL